MNTNKLKTLIITIGILLQLTCFKTLTAQFWQSNFGYLQNTQTYNPAYAGVKVIPTINLNYHRLKILDASNLIEGGFHTQLNKIPLGLGVSYKRDKFDFGITQDYAIQDLWNTQVK